MRRGSRPAPTCGRRGEKALPPRPCRLLLLAPRRKRKKRRKKKKKKSEEGKNWIELGGVDFVESPCEQRRGGEEEMCR